jgi:hypothetical protein
MDKCDVTALIDAVLQAGGRLALEDGKPIWVASKPLPRVLTEQLFSRRAEIIEYLERANTAVQRV